MKEHFTYKKIFIFNSIT